jgi:hypothetical protein
MPNEFVEKMLFRFFWMLQNRFYCRYASAVLPATFWCGYLQATLSS